MLEHRPAVFVVRVRYPVREFPDSNSGFCFWPSGLTPPQVRPPRRNTSQQSREHRRTGGGRTSTDDTHSEKRDDKTHTTQRARGGGEERRGNATRPEPQSGDDQQRAAKCASLVLLDPTPIEDDASEPRGRQEQRRRSGPAADSKAQRRLARPKGAQGNSSHDFFVSSLIDYRVWSFV